MNAMNIKEVLVLELSHFPETAMHGMSLSIVLSKAGILMILVPPRVCFWHAPPQNYHYTTVQLYSTVP